MSDPILSREEVERLWHNSNNDGTLQSQLMGFASSLQDAWLEKVCGEPYLYVYEYDRIGYVHRQLHAGMWNGARESRSIPLYAVNRSKP